MPTRQFNKKKKGNKSRNHEISRNNLTKGHRFRSLPKSTRQFWPIVESRSEINEVTLTLFYKSQSITRKKKGRKKKKNSFCKNIIKYPGMTPLVKDTSKKKKKVCPDEVSSSDKFFYEYESFLSFFLPSFLFHLSYRSKKKNEEILDECEFQLPMQPSIFSFLSFFLEKFFPEFSRAYIRRNTYIGGVSRRIKKG